MPKPKVHEAEVVEEKALVMTGEAHQAMAVMSVKEMKAQMKVESEKREILTKYITDHFKNGIDFGQIHIMPKDKCSTPYNCANPRHFSKPTLFKAGAEKFLSLFRLRVEYAKDVDTWEMLGSQSNTISYIARLYTANGVMVGEGRGVCTTGEKSGSANTAVKIAQKRAKIDAVLSSGGLSDFFTQDLEEDSYKDGKFDAAQTPKETPKPTTPKQIEAMALAQVKNTRSVDKLIQIDEGQKKSKKLSKAAQDRISKAISARVAELESEDADQSKKS